MQIHRLKSYKDLDFFEIHLYNEHFPHNDSWDLHLANFALVELQILIPMKKFFWGVIYYSSKNQTVYVFSRYLTYMYITFSLKTQYHRFAYMFSSFGSIYFITFVIMFILFQWMRVMAGRCLKL